MKKSIYILSILSAILFFTRCEKNKQILEIELPKHTPKLVAYAFFEDSFTKEIQVYHSLGTLEKNYKKIKNANITLFKNDEILTDNFHFEENSPSSPSNYTPDHLITLGSTPDTYKMTISATGYDKVEATSKMPGKVPIKKISYEIEGSIDEEGETVDKIKLAFDDPSDEENFYIFTTTTVSQEFYVDPNTGDTTYFQGGGNSYLSTIDPRVNQYYLNNIFLQDDLSGAIILFSDKNFDGQQVDFTFTAYSGLRKEDHLEGTATMKLYSIPKDMYYFIQSAGQYEKAQEAIFPEPVVIHSNFDKGYGVFSVYQVDKKEIELE